MDQKRTLTMNWEGLLAEDEDDDQFFESYSRISSAVSHDAAGSSDSDSDEEEYEDGRISFASALTSASIKSFHSLKSVVTTPNAVVASPSPTAAADYNLWMAEPGSITERRKRLLHDMGLSSNRDLLRITSSSRRKVATILAVDSSSPLEESKGENSPSPSPSSPSPSPSNSNSNSNSTPVLLVRSRSDGDIDSFSASAKQRKEELIGPVSKQRLTRTLSGSSAAPCTGAPRVISPKKSRRKSSFSSRPTNNGKFSSFFLIKNLDTGKEFIVKEFNEEGMWNKLSDLQTGKQLTMEEFEKSLGYSPVVKELMRRETVSKQYDDGRKVGVNSYLSKSFRNSKRRGVALLKNIKGVATTMSGLMADKEREPPQSPPVDHRRNTQWVKVRQQGKSYKEFTAMHLSQEIQAHEGSIWTVRFSLDARYLASAGEDKVIRVWEVQDCEVMTTRPPEDFYYSNSTPLHPSACSSPDVPLLGEAKLLPSERGSRRGKVGSNRKKSSSSIPDYVHMPEAVFALSERPVCTFKGHLEDVLDLSWSKSQLLLSSSMDKTVRLWDMETRSCLKLFAHNDYVTCIQFNPVDDDYFISGSLDAKVRIWNIPDRQVVDWTDVHEMVTAACYTPDGQGALIGSHKGSCHYYGIFDCKIEEKDDINIRHKKKSQAKKITGFQFSPCNTYEVIITSADSRIRIFDGSDIVHKFKGFRNTSSQISASFTPDGKYIVSASEDSHVYIWRHDDLRNSGSGKSKNLVTTQSHEHFQCRDVSVAIPWPGSIKFEPPTVEVHSKRHSRRSIPQPNSSGGSPTRENSNLVGTNSKGQLPPLPKRSNRLERLTSYPDEDLAQHSHTDSAIGIGDSFNSATNSSRFGESPSISASGCSPSQSWSSSWSWFDNSGSQGGQTVQATAWGMVIVTAGLGGEIRVYQNFGLPLKVGR